jgi:hypothetical protein
MTHSYPFINAVPICTYFLKTVISHLQLGIGIGMEEQDHSGSLWRWEPQAGNAAAIGLRTSAKEKPRNPGCICCLLMELQHEKPLVAPIVLLGRLVMQWYLYLNVNSGLGSSAIARSWFD